MLQILVAASEIGTEEYFCIYYIFIQDHLQREADELLSLFGIWSSIRFHVNIQLLQISQKKRKKKKQ